MLSSPHLPRKGEDPRNSHPIHPGEGVQSIGGKDREEHSTVSSRALLCRNMLGILVLCLYMAENHSACDILQWRFGFLFSGGVGILGVDQQRKED